MLYLWHSHLWPIFWGGSTLTSAMTQWSWHFSLLIEMFLHFQQWWFFCWKGFFTFSQVKCELKKWLAFVACAAGIDMVHKLYDASVTKALYFESQNCMFAFRSIFWHISKRLKNSAFFSPIIQVTRRITISVQSTSISVPGTLSGLLRQNTTGALYKNCVRSKSRSSLHAPA